METPDEPLPSINPRKYFYVDACENCAWHLQIWRKSGDGEVTFVPFRCRSWRHEGECRLWRGAQDFTRIQEGLESLDSWSHVTLTFMDQWRELNDKVFRRCKNCWAVMRKRIIRRHGNFKYIQTWEVHRSGWPHVHIAISNNYLFSVTGGEPAELFATHLREDAVKSGFGFVGWLKPLTGPKEMAGYLCKLATELTGGGKEYQVPINAPKNFRRLRASQKLLPPPHKDPDFTGVLKFCALGVDD